MRSSGLTTEFRQQLLASLNFVTKSIESAFLDIADNFPKLMQALEASVEETNREISEIQNERSDLHSTTLSLPKLIGKTSVTVERLLNRFHRMEAADKELVEAMESGSNLLELLRTNIAEINEDSVEMELISLNALTVALKAGNSGRGFSVITGELQRLSTTVMETAEAVNKDSADLESIFNEFSRTLVDASKRQDEIRFIFNEQIQGTFSGFISGLDEIINQIRITNDKALQVKKPITNLMVEIQSQDIIRQSIESVIAIADSLKSINFSQHSNISDAYLDELSFLNFLPNLCYAILEDIREKLLSSTEALSQRLNAVKESVERISSELEEFIRSSVEGSEESLSGRFKTAEELLISMHNSIIKLVSEKSDEAKRSLTLITKVKSLNKQFKLFSVLVERFLAIDVASRIEVSKNSVLGDMTDTVTSMTNLTNRISQHVDVSGKATGKFLSQTKQAVHTFQRLYDEEVSPIKKANSAIKSLIMEMKSGKDQLLLILTNFGLFSDQFFHIFEQTENDLEKLHQLNSTIATVQSKLVEFREKTEEELSFALKSQGIERWNVAEGQISSLMEKFTIFTHKKTAGILSDTEVEEGVDSGDVTFF